MYVLGISAYYHDSGVALIEDGVVTFAAQEERFTRKKHDASFPHNALSHCLSKIKGGLSAVNTIVFYENPFLKFGRLVETYVALAPKGLSSYVRRIPNWLQHKLYQKKHIISELAKFSRYTPTSVIEERLVFSKHHLSHAGSAFFPSPFEEAAVLTVDGVGEWTTTGVFLGKGNQLTAIKEINFPHSLGLLYSAFTYYLGFKVNDGEYKVMGLAPYGVPKYKEKILDQIIDVKPDGSFRLNLAYFNFCTGFRMINKKFIRLFEKPERLPQDEITQFHMDIAASLQSVIELVMLKLTRAIATETKAQNLCLAGGVALNCVANGKILKEGLFKDIWIQPAAGDAGGALGAALCVYHMHAKQPRNLNNCQMKDVYLGPEYSQISIEKKLEKMGANFSILTDKDLIDTTAKALCDGKVVGWFQGRMEFGPRALGNRSILADPRNKTMQSTLNLKIKNRESFRPFAPAILQEKTSEWFTQSKPSPYMLLITEVNAQHRKPPSDADRALKGTQQINAMRSSVPAITHIDYSARLQTVSKDSNPQFYSLIKRFEEETHCPLLVNTSFNVSDEPIVESPENAYHCFMNTKMDILVAGNCFLVKEKQT